MNFRQWVWRVAMVWCVAGGRECLAAEANNGAAGGEYQVVARTASSRVWQQALVFTNDAGVVGTNVSSYTELSDGACFWDGKAWVDAAPQIGLVQDGATSSGTQFSVHWAADVASSPAVTVTCWNGVAYRTRMAGLSFWDAESGSNVMVAEIQDAQGILYGSNNVVYPNCFSGNNIVADLSYLYGPRRPSKM